MGSTQKILQLFHIYIILDNVLRFSSFRCWMDVFWGVYLFFCVLVFSLFLSSFFIILVCMCVWCLLHVFNSSVFCHCSIGFEINIFKKQLYTIYISLFRVVYVCVPCVFLAVLMRLVTQTTVRIYIL